MTEVDKLRALLDERGVEWTKVPDETAEGSEYLLSLTYWGDAGEQGSYVASEVFGGLKVDPLTAEQAVDATLGREVTPMLVSDDLGHVLITLGGIKTWDVTEDAATLGRGECEWQWAELWQDTDIGRECEYAHWTLDCGCWDEFDERFQDYDDYERKPEGVNFCERCGKAVKR